jgi:hypothetical protein
LLEGFEAKEMLCYKHSGFSVDTSVCIAAQDRAGLERLLRYCARPPFAMERLRKAGSALVYRCAKQRSEPGGNPHNHSHNKRGTKVDEITLTPLELIDRIAALVPPPRTHRHRRAQTQCGPGKRMIARPSLYPYPSNALRTFCGRC